MNYFLLDDNVRWLLDTPIGDQNAKNALKRATVSELEQVLEQLPLEGNKTKIKALQAELKRKKKNGISED